MMLKIRKAIKYLCSRALFLYLVLRKHNNEIYVLLNDHMGDILYSLAFWDDLKNQNTTKKFVLVLEKKHKYILEDYQEIKKTLTIPDVPIMNKIYVSMLNDHILAEHGLKKGIINAEPWYFPEMHNSTEGNMALLKKRIFKLSEPTQICYHYFPKTEITSIQDFDRIKDKVVIINPYSASMTAEMSLFEAIADTLTKRGYYVFSNVVADQKPVKNTRVLNCSVKELYNIALHSFLFVSIRSGIVDAVIPTNIKMFVIYEIKDELTEFIANNFRLAEWETDGIFDEVFYRNKSEMDLIPARFETFLDSIENGER